MSSLLENLVDVLDRECALYEKLLELSSRKTPVIIQRDLKELSKITEDEQVVVSFINAVDKEREGVMDNIAEVIGEKGNDLKLTDLVRMLNSRPAEQKALAIKRDRLKEVSTNVQRVNDQNQMLLQSSLEMVQYEMNIIQSARRAPETANYTRYAGTRGDRIGVAMTGRFDAKQ
ncbi:flagellar protein FlgN [Butyrivibrio sp. WCD3002]|uniref:flagellar protein FlgN n=1 Tax=Butyrivibrio sp. WCD3002 TaxID=1280676 RepID=UPI00041A8538|nr:flagellar protein FlgN [Butyrivibrio sp. WCD3002]